jgi:hypothetical protein
MSFKTELGLRLLAAWLGIGAIAQAATASLGSRTKLCGEQKQWHKLAFTFAGPYASEGGSPNPFRNYRLDVTFTHVATGRRLIVPGFFAADGNAANTGATAGTCWEADFAPDATGAWTYSASFRTGADVAVSTAVTAGTATGFDGECGSFTVDASDKTGADFRASGRLQPVGQRYLQFLGSKKYFIKTGSGSPETFLAFGDFDNTVAGKSILHRYANHVQDYRAGDPSWKGGRGQGIIGVLNYLGARGVNSLYFLTMNIGGDGDNVWPYVTKTDVTRFDVSKLAQWEIVFSHMDRVGILLHVFTQERENDHLLDGGALGLQRKLYYRELIARFGHHLGLIWNLGEETTNTTAQLLAFADYINAVDPYLHAIDVHTYPTERDQVYGPLLGSPLIHGAALQLESPDIVHSETLKWVNKSGAAGDQWIVNADEQGPASTGAVPDANDPTHTSLVRRVLWGNLFAGGGGVEWYFGYSYPNNDLNCEDWRPRAQLWTVSKYAADFVRTYLPLPLVQSCDGLTSCTSDYVLGKPGVAYAVYLPGGGTTSITLPAGECYTVAWFNPRKGGALQAGTIAAVAGGTVGIGFPPVEQTQDWVALLRRSDGTTASSGTSTGTTATAPSVTGLTLVNAATQLDERTLVDGTVISLATDGVQLNVRADVGGTVGSVAFYLDGTLVRTESAAPYALAGDDAGVYRSWTPAVGAHTLRVVPYSGTSRTGTAGAALQVGFTVEP